MRRWRGCRWHGKRDPCDTDNPDTDKKQSSPWAQTRSEARTLHRCRRDARRKIGLHGREYDGMRADARKSACVGGKATRETVGRMSIQMMT